MIKSNNAYTVNTFYYSNYYYKVITFGQDPMGANISVLDPVMLAIHAAFAKVLYSLEADEYVTKRL